MVVTPLTYLRHSLTPVSHSSLVTEDHGEVCPLSGGVMSPTAQPLSALLPSGFRLLPAPSPAAPSAILADRFPP